MNTTPFQPKGDVAEWRMVYDHARTLQPGDLITYTELAAILGRDEVDPDKMRGPVRRAKKELRKRDRRTFVCVHTEGYRIAHPTEHADLAQLHGRKADRQIDEAIAESGAADRNLLTPEQAAQIDAIEMTNRRIKDAVKQINRRTEKIDKAVAAAHSAEMGELSKIIEQQAKMMEAMKRRGILD